MFCGIAVQTETEYAKIEIMKDPLLFNKLSKEGIIYFLKKNSEEKFHWKTNWYYESIVNNKKPESSIFVRLLVILIY